MPKFLHAADLHIDSPLIGLEQRYGRAPIERIRAATRRALENMVKLAIDEQVAFVLLAGDSFDTDPTLETELFFRSQMQRLSDAGIPIVAVLGNHDHAGLTPKRVRLPERMTVLPHDRPGSHAPVDGVVVHGRSYPYRQVKDDLSIDYPSPLRGSLNIGLLHTVLTDTVHAAYSPTSPAALAARGYPYWALGHVHTRDSFGERGVRIEFPGNLQGRHARETGPKGALLVEYAGERIGAVEHRALDVVRWHHVQIDAAKVEGDLVDAVKMRVLAETAGDREARRLAAVRVTVTGVPMVGEARTNADKLKDELLGELVGRDEDVWLEKVRVETTSAAAGGAELEGQLASLVESLAADGSSRLELVGLVNEMRDRLGKIDKDLVEQRGDDSAKTEAETLVGDRREMSEADARELLSRALGVVLTERR